MPSEDDESKGPDLREGARAPADGDIVAGHVDGERALLAGCSSGTYAISAVCTHYGGPLSEGTLVGDEIVCPWHHARFDVRTGVPTRAPALRPIRCYRTETSGGRVHVIGKKPSPTGASIPPAPRVQSFKMPRSVVIVGGGASGVACAERLRQRGFGGDITILSSEEAAPVDRPNLSKDFLAGNVAEDVVPVFPPQHYKERGIKVVLDSQVSSIDVLSKEVVVSHGVRYGYDALLLATGAAPARLRTPGFGLPHVFTLRTLADSHAILKRVSADTRAVVIGSGFIGLEVAASLRAHGMEVHVVSTERGPLRKILGQRVSDFVRDVHKEHGVIFHPGHRVVSIDASTVKLDDGRNISCELVVAGVGVTPRTRLAEDAGLHVDDGIVTDEYLRASAPNVFAAGDVARWPYFDSGSTVRVEHWVVAERMGQIAADNMIGLETPCRLVPFFWSQHYDFSISYVGYAKKWDRVGIRGDLERRDAEITYKLGDRALAVATIGRDGRSIDVERELESHTRGPSKNQGDWTAPMSAFVPRFTS
jgi:NADPH-dependent 2,4-dienoyl-CoA reductase/sulfur reductase-like enzyme/nitrite reductase/ring-hydroxylating ferredoxin subunit